MAVVAVYLVIIARLADAAQRLVHFAHAAWRKQHIAAKCDQRNFSANRQKSVREVIVVARTVKDIHHLYDIKVAQRIKALWKAVAVVLHIAIDLKPARKLVKAVGLYVVAAEF